MEFVTVTNNNEESFSQRFDGTNYEFPPGQPVTMPERAAGWIFAYGMTDTFREKILVRNGWNKQGGLDQDSANKILGNFVFNVLVSETKAAKSGLKPVRVMTGINAVNPNTENNPSRHIKMPGKAGQLAPVAKAA